MEIDRPATGPDGLDADRVSRVARALLGVLARECPADDPGGTVLALAAADLFHAVVLVKAADDFGFTARERRARFREAGRLLASRAAQVDAQAER